MIYPIHTVDSISTIPWTSQPLLVFKCRNHHQNLKTLRMLWHDYYTMILVEQYRVEKV